MTCRKAERMMYLYREGELSSSSRAALERHCRTCSSCAHDLQGLEVLKDATAALRTLEAAVPDGLVTGVLAEVSQRQGSNASRFHMQPRAWRFAIAAVLSIITLLPVAQNVIDAGRIEALESRLAHTQMALQPPSTADIALWAALRQTGVRDLPADPVLQEELWTMAVRFAARALREGPAQVRDQILERQPLLYAVVQGKIIAPAERRRALTELGTLLNESHYLTK